MSYESLERELARRQSKRQSRRSKGDKKSKRKYSPYRRGGRKGSKTRTRLAEGEDKLGKALAAARERAAKYAKPRLNITKLPDRDQRSLKDFDAETLDWLETNKEYAPTELIIKRLKESGVWELGDDPGMLPWDAFNWWATVKIKDGTLVRARKGESRNDRFNINIILIVDEMAEGYGRVTVSYTDIHNADWEDSYPEEMEQLHNELTIIFKNNGMFQSGDYLEYGDMGEFYNVHWGDLVRHDCANNAELDSYEDGIIVMECNTCGRTATFRQETPYDGPRNAETFDAETFNVESKDEAIVVEGYRPKRVETYMGTVALFYVGEMAERRYGPMSVTYQERTLLLPPIPNSIVNPTGITVEDVDEIMQHYTGAPWTGEYVLFSDDTGHLVDSGRTRQYADFDSEEFRAEPAMYVKCFECEKPGYSDEMSKIAFGHLCARCARPEINWDTYSAESGLNNTHRDILTYLSPFNPKLVHRKYGIPTGLTQREIGNAIGTVRTNATKHLQDLIELGLVTQIMRRPDGERRKVKVYLPTYEGRKIAESFRAEDLNGNGVIDAWETHAHENTLTGLAHEETHFSETFRANLRKTNLKPSQIREKAQEAFEGVTGWMWLSELTGKINSTLSARQRIAPGVVSRAIGNSKGGHYGFYVTLDKRIFYYGDKDRGEFIKGVI